MKINKTIKGVMDEYKERPIKYFLVFMGGFITTKVVIGTMDKRK